MSLVGKESMDKRLEAYPSKTTIVVQWGEMDALGHVNHVSYVRWLETGRIDYLANVGLWDEDHARTSIVIASVSVDYRRQSRHPDQMIVGTRVVNLGGSSFDMEHGIFSQTQNVMVVRARSVAVYFDFERQRPARLPTEIRQRIREFEKNADL